MVLPAGVADTPGKVELWPFQAGIADAMSDPDIEEITLVKPTRVGFTTLLSGYVASHVANDPAPLGVYLPTEDDCRTYMVSVLEPIFDATVAVRGALGSGVDQTGRNTLLHRMFPGGSLQVMAARAARNFRAKNFRVVLLDEVDAMEPTSEGNPLDLAAKRTDSFRNRKIVKGSTPVRISTSNVLRSYETSDKRIYECPCPACGAATEILWQHIVWQKKQPETAAFLCPHCNEVIEERHKRTMVDRGAWRATRPEVQRHAGFRMNALISLLPNTTWAHLASEWLAKYRDPDTRQVFINTRLAEGWADEGEEIDPTGLKARVENDIGLDRLPKDVLALTAGVDVQVDRIEVSMIGWGRPIEVAGKLNGRDETFDLNPLVVLDHTVIFGRPDDAVVWEHLDDLLAKTYKHPLGGQLKVTATIVDSGNWSDEVYDYCFPRFHRSVMAGKGMPGMARMSIMRSKQRFKSDNGHLGTLFQVGVDALKNRIFTRLPIINAIRFSSDVLSESPEYFEQLTGEKRMLRFVNGQPKHVFERKTSGTPVEALDCLVYAWAARDTLDPNWDALEARLTVNGSTAPKRTLADLARELSGNK